MRFTPALLCLLVIFLSHALASLSSRSSSGDADVSRRDAVKAAFEYNYGKYVQYAYGKDYLNVQSKQGENDGTTAGFGATIVESLGLMQVMGLTETEMYRNATTFVQQQTFMSTKEKAQGNIQGSVKVFELTIRYLGALLSAYQFNGEKKEEIFFVEKAQQLADRLRAAWWGKNRIPVSILNMRKQKPVDVNADTNAAEAGTLTMEWGTLSQYTRNPVYAKLVEGSVDALREAKPFFPGLIFSHIYPGNESFATQYITPGGGFDSYLEYLIKYPVLLGQRGHRFVQTYTAAIESIQKHLVVKSGVNNFTFLSDYNAEKSTSVYVFSHLACFIGGNVAMAGRLLDRPDWTQLGLELTESCAGTYANMALKLGPYGFGYADRTGDFTGWDYVSRARRDFYNKHGLFTSVGYWFQAPEVVESIFYAYRITGLPIWRDMAWQIFNDIKKVADSGDGWAAITNVNDESSGIEPQQMSFLYAETLKYLYLIFEDSRRISLDDYVFNTEGHIFRRAKGDFSPIQGNVAYKPITGKDDPSGKRCSTDPGQAPGKLFVAQPGSSRDDVAHDLTAHTCMPRKVAMTMLSIMRG